MPNTVPSTENIVVYKVSTALPLGNVNTLTDTITIFLSVVQKESHSTTKAYKREKIYSASLRYDLKDE